MVRIECLTPRGFCFGVQRALELLNNTVDEKPYVLHDIVHNTQIVNDYKKKGVTFVQNIKDIPDGKTCVISAHGAPLQTFQQAQEKNLNIVDATCPLVKKVHKQVQAFAQQKRFIVLIGTPNHDETVGTIGHIPENAPYVLISSPQEAEKLPNIPLGIVSQTTWNEDKIQPILTEIKKHCSDIIYQKGVCQATSERQKAVKEACQWADTLLVVGDEKSANAGQLKQIALERKKQAYILQTQKDLEGKKIKGNVAITAAASAPEKIVQDVFKILKEKHR